MKKKDKMISNIENAWYICSKCAENNGAKWPDGHFATFHVGNCDVCKKDENLSNVGDWNWPDGKARGMRD